MSDTTFTIPDAQQAIDNLMAEAFESETKREPIAPADLGAVSRADHSNAYERCLKYLEKLDDSVSGQGGHTALLRASRACVRFDLDESEYRWALAWFSANKSDPPWSDREIDHKMSEGRKVFDAERGKLLLDDRKPLSGAATRNGATVTNDDAEDGDTNHTAQREPGLIVRTAADIVVRPVSWFWNHVLVGGAINLLIGMPDQGKSVLTMDLAARFTRGTPWPLGDHRDNPGGSVAILALEDSPETTIVPRLKAAGADLSKVLLVEGVTRIDTNPRDDKAKRFKDAFDIGRDIEKLDSLRKHHPDLGLVIIDPLDSYLGRIDTKTGNEVRAALWPLKDWCEQSGVTAIIVHHFNKSASTNAIDRVSGSRSFGALPRSVWMIGKDAEAGDNRSLLLPIKLNLVRDPQGMAYRIASLPENPELPVVQWLAEPTDRRAADMLGAERTATDDAADFLRDVLGDGPMEVAAIRDRAKEAGVAWRTVERAKQRAGVRSEQLRDGGHVIGWRWALKGRAEE